MAKRKDLYEIHVSIFSVNAFKKYNYANENFQYRNLIITLIIKINDDL